jgi:hypothetical protein
MTKSLKKIEAVFTDPFTFFPFMFGLAGLTMPTSIWNSVGYLHIPKNEFCSFLIILGTLGYILRWYQRSHPRKWLVYVKINALVYIIIGTSLAWSESRTGVVIFITFLFHCLKETCVHLIFTRCRSINHRR